MPPPDMSLWVWLYMTTGAELWQVAAVGITTLAFWVAIWKLKWFRK